MSPLGRVGLIHLNWRREQAQTMAEYVVILAVITPALVLAFSLFGGSVVPVFDTVRGLL
jgi:Flp pilus assembly pilin Flp